MMINFHNYFVTSRYHFLTYTDNLARSDGGRVAMVRAAQELCIPFIPVVLVRDILERQDDSREQTS